MDFGYVLKDKNDPITRNEHTCPVNLLKTIVFREYIEKPFAKNLEMLKISCWCTSTGMKNSQDTDEV